MLELFTPAATVYSGFKSAKVFCGRVLHVFTCAMNVFLKRARRLSQALVHFCDRTCKFVD